uniref:HEPN_AbiU2 domain-containing protein n=1 Tax=Strongyloides papillosus TaxID=174720 RepID=A0A0N5BF16_STREA
MYDYPPSLNVSIETFFESIDNQLKSYNVEWESEFKKEIIEINFLQSACLNIAKSLYHVCGVFKKTDGLKYVNAFLKKYIYSDHQNTTKELIFKSHRHLRDKYLKSLKQNNGIRSNNASNVDETFDIHAEAKKFEKSMFKNEEKGLEYSVEHYIERHRIYAVSSYEKFFELVPSLSSYTRYLLENDI